MKKAISIFLAVLMTVIMLPLSVFAQDNVLNYLEYEINNGEVIITDCDSSISGDITIPDTIEGYPVITIGDSAFYDCDSLTNITIPNSVTSINEWAFASCDSLTNIIIPDNVTIIDWCAFWKCDSLTSVTIGDSVTTIGDSAFISCGNLTNVIIGNSVTTIGDSAFMYCGRLENVKLPNNVTLIGDSAFCCCDSLASITIPNSVTTIGYKAFSDCDSITNITVPDSVTSISSYAFYDCDSLASIKISDSITSINEWTFASCDSLANIIIPDNVTIIDWCTFWGCGNLTSITIPDSVIYIGDSAFEYCDNLNTVYYTGTAEQWNSISIASGNECLTNADIIFNSTGSDSTYYLTISSTNSTNSVPVKEELKFRVNQYRNGKELTEEKEYAISFSDAEIFDISSASVSSSNNNAFFDIRLKAKKAGTTIMTVNDPDTGAYISVTLTATEEMNVWRFDSVPSAVYQKDRTTNFYNINGLCVDSFSYFKVEEKDKEQGEKYRVSMNVYNGKHHYGAAVAYDKYGNIFDYDIIKPLKEYESSIVELGVDAWLSLRDTFKLFGDGYYYTGETITQYNHVTLNVPDDGYIIITNNCKENEIAYLANAIEITINAALSTGEALVGMAGKVDTGIIVENALDTLLKEITEDILVSVVKSSAQSLANVASYNSINSNISALAEKLNNKGINFIKILTDIINIELGIGITEAALLKILPTGEIINSYFLINNACNAILLADNIKDSHNAPQIAIYSPINDDEEYISNGVIVKPEQKPDPEYVLHSFIIADDNVIHINTDNALDAISDTRTIYNITLYKDGKEAQPETKIKVMIPIPENYDKNNLVIYWCKEDGTLEIMNTHIEGNYIVFETSHLSYYALVSINHDENSHTPGDLNGDGNVNASDARTALRISAQLDIPTEAQLIAADVNGDSRVTASDARIILRVSAKLETL